MWPIRQAVTPLSELFARKPLLEDVAQTTLARLAASAIEREASKGQTLYRPDEPWPYLGVLLEGTLGMFAEGGYRDYLYEEILPGDFFGVAAMFDAHDAMARMVVLSRKAKYVAIESAVARSLCDADPMFAVLLARVLAKRVRGLTSLLVTQVTLPTMVRMARYLLQHCVQEPGLLPSVGPLPLMTQAQIAAAAGTTKEVAARLIRTLEEAGALRRERGHIRYLDRDRIAVFATANQREPHLHR